MPSVELSEVQGIEDVLLTHRYSIDFPSDIPGSGNGAELNIRCQQVVFPGSSINPVETLLHGFKRYEFGRKEFTGTFTATFVETRDMPIWTALKSWQEEIRGTGTGISTAPRDELIVNAEIRVFDEQNNAAEVCTVFNCWPQDVPEVQLDSTGETQFLVTPTFSYDYLGYGQSTGLPGQASS